MIACPRLWRGAAGFGIVASMIRNLLLALLVAAAAGGAGAAPVEIHYFWAATCPDCQVMKAFLAALAAEFPELRVVEHEVALSKENFQLLEAVTKAYGLDRFATPVVAVGDLATTGIGLASELRIREEVARCAREGCPSPLARVKEIAPSRSVPWGWILLALGVTAVLVLLVLR